MFALLRLCGCDCWTEWKEMFFIDVNDNRLDVLLGNWTGLTQTWENGICNGKTFSMGNAQSCIKDSICKLNNFCTSCKWSEQTESQIDSKVGLDLGGISLCWASSSSASWNKWNELEGYGNPHEISLFQFRINRFPSYFFFFNYEYAIFFRSKWKSNRRVERKRKRKNSSNSMGFEGKSRFRSLIINYFRTRCARCAVRDYFENNSFWAELTRHGVLYAFRESM